MGAPNRCNFWPKVFCGSIGDPAWHFLVESMKVFGWPGPGLETALGNAAEGTLRSQPGPLPIPNAPRIEYIARNLCCHGIISSAESLAFRLRNPSYSKSKADFMVHACKQRVLFGVPPEGFGFQQSMSGRAALCQQHLSQATPR